MLAGATETLRGRENIQVACCTYHRQEDATTYAQLFKSLGFSVEFSEGVMLLWFAPDLAPPYFRKALLRATKK